MSTQKFYFLAIPVTTCSVEGGKIQCNFALIQKHTFVFSQKARQVTAVLLNGFTCAKISQRLSCLDSRFIKHFAKDSAVCPWIVFNHFYGLIALER